MKLRKQMGYKKNQNSSSDVIKFTERMMNTEADLIKKYTGKDFNYELFWKKAIDDTGFWGWHIRMTTIAISLDAFKDYGIRNIYLNEDGFISQVETAIEDPEAYNSYMELINGVWNMSLEQIMKLVDKFFSVKKTA